MGEGDFSWFNNFDSEGNYIPPDQTNFGDDTDWGGGTNDGSNTSWGDTDSTGFSLGGLGGSGQSGLFGALRDSIGGSGGGLSGLLGAILSGPGKGGWGSVLPGTLALAYADRQNGIDTSGIESVVDRLRGNMSPVIRAAIDPFERNIAAGYGDLLQSQAKRGIRGSSFGDASIGNFLATTGRELANAGANAAQGSLSLEGTLSGNIAQLKQKSQEMKNSLFGRAFDTLGRGLNPAGYGMYPSGA